MVFMYMIEFHPILQSWPDDALAIVAQRFLDEVEMDDSTKDGCVEMCKEFHQTTRKLSDRYLATLQRHNYVTPTSYLELISTYKTLLSRKRRCCDTITITPLSCIPHCATCHIVRFRSCGDATRWD